MLANRLKKGDTIGIIAPSDAITKENLEDINRSILLMEGAGYKIEFGKNVFSNSTGYGASVKEKVEDLQHMFQDKNIKMVWCAKGGNNSNNMFDYIDYELIKKNPKIICGYSDSTSLLNAIHEKTGLVTFLGETFKGLTTWQTDYSYREVIKRLQDGSLELGREDDIYNIIKEGKAEGILVGGNLSLTTKQVCGKYSIDFKDKILFIEELGFESEPAKVSSDLYYMKQNGVFDEIKGIWIGNYEYPSNISLEKIVLDVLGEEYNFPIIKSNNFGHTDRKTLIPIGTKAKIENGKIKLQEDCLLSC